MNENAGAFLALAAVCAFAAMMGEARVLLPVAVICLLIGAIGLVME